MSLFSKLFSNSETPSNPSIFQYIEDEIQLNDIISSSTEKFVIIFKHSDRCSISRWVWRQFQADYNLTEETAILYLVDVVSNRNISQKIAADFDVHHESPQLLIIHQNKCVYNASHENINFDDVLKITTNKI